MTIDEAIEGVDDATIAFFGGVDNIKKFINLVCHTSSIGLSGSRLHLKAVELVKVVNADKSLMQAINLAKDYAAEIAGGVLYERAVYGYDEEVYDIDEKKIKRVHKYSDRALIDYLKANDAKYKVKSAKSSNTNEPLRLELVSFN